MKTNHHQPRHPLLLLLLLSAFQLFSFSAFPATYSLTNIQLPKVTGVLGFTNADSAPTGMAKVAVSLINLSNVVANITNSGSGGGSSNGFYILSTNGVGTNLWVWQPFIIAGPSMKTWIDWTNPPVNPTNQPPDWTNNACTNLAGPYYESATNGFFTNDCGFGITIGDGGDTNANGGWETNNLAQVTNSGMRYLKSLHVSGNSMTGDYIWTNGVFWLNGAPDNCTPKTVHFNNSANTWVARNGNTFYNNSAGAALLGTWNGATYTTNSYDTNSGFPYAYWPGFAVAISGITGVSNLNGLYQFHHRVDTVITLTNLWSSQLKTAYAFDTSFIDTIPTHTCAYDSDAYWPNSAALGELTLSGSNGTVYAANYWPFPTNGSRSFNVYGGASGTPRADYFARKSQMTNAIVIVQPLPGGVTGGISGGNPPRLTYQAGTNCTYLQTLLQYSEFIDAMNTLYCQPSGTNCGHIFLSTNGTAYVYAAGTLYYTIPQSNTQEWRPCP